MKLGVVLIESRVDKHSGKFDGLNCHDDEKVKRFREKYGNTEIERFYSDRLSNKTLAELVKDAYFVKSNKI